MNLQSETPIKKNTKSGSDYEYEFKELPKAQPMPDKESGSDEPLGYTHYTEGKPKVIIDDNYLEPFYNDIILRHNEYRK